MTELKKEAEVTLKNVEDDHRISERELKADRRALKVQQKEEEIRHADYLTALRKENDKKATAIRSEHDRIGNEIKTKYNHKMLLLRKEMEEKRKALITQIENKKNQAIKDLTTHHAKKYNEIKSYYVEIINTNLDIIKQLKDELTSAKRDDNNKLNMLQEEENKNRKVVKPLREAM